MKLYAAYSDLPRMRYYFVGFQSKITKSHIAPPRCIKIQLTLFGKTISCSLFGDFFHFSIMKHRAGTKYLDGY